MTMGANGNQPCAGWAAGLWDAGHCLLDAYWADHTPWEALAGLGQAILLLGRTLGHDYHCPAPQVWVHCKAHVSPDARLAGPCVVCEGATVRPQAYVRGAVLVGRGAMVGHCTEVKNSVLFDMAQAPHFNYVGDSILGYRAHLGAGAILSNVRGDKAPVRLHLAAGTLPTPLCKLGSLVGDDAEIGCNAVLNPGCVVGHGARIYPLVGVRGHVPAGAIVTTGNLTR